MSYGSKDGYKKHVKRHSDLDNEKFIPLEYIVEFLKRIKDQ